MNQFENKFFEEYKDIDNLIKQMYSSPTGVSEYILRMSENTKGNTLIDNWQYHYRYLKKVRHIRNQIAHDDLEVEYNEDDLNYLYHFHDCLLKLKDPLSELNRSEANKVHPIIDNKEELDDEYYDEYKNNDFDTTIKLIILIIIGLIIIFLEIKLK